MEIARFGADCPMFVRPLFCNPLHPASVQNLEVGEAEILKHPEHAPLIAPVVKRIGVDDDVTVMVDPERPNLALQHGHIRI